jgi:peptide deformylase
VVKKVVQMGSETLHISCMTIKDFSSAKSVINNLKDTITYLKTQHAFKRGIGLAAPQIGETIRVSIAEYNDKQYVLINPMIIGKSEEKKLIREGCISFFEYRAMVPRYNFVKVKAYDENGKEYFVEGYGDFAMLLQHELDHLDGILYIYHLPNGRKDLFKK